MDGDGNGMTCPCREPDGRMGFCPVRNRPMAAHHINLCRTDLRYRDAFTSQKVPKGDPPKGGPGTELSAILRKLGITERAGCGCKKKARLMDKWGVDGCRAKLDQIATWLCDESEERGMPISHLTAVAVVRLAIWRAKRQKKPNGLFGQESK